MQATCYRFYNFFLLIFMLVPLFMKAQVNTVQFGKNRVQYKKFNWKFYQSKNFNTYFNQGGLELGKYVTQVAEDELESIESAVEYSLQRRANIVIYNTYDDYKTTNIGGSQEWQNPGGLTKLVNNKMVVYFDGDHSKLKIQIRQGIAKILVDNLLFGDDLGEIASNQALLDLPKWLTDGYVQYIAEPWSTEKDDELKSAMLGSSYKNFYQFAFEKPDIAGNAFWYYISEKYGKQNVSYFLYLARLYKNLNTASQRICKKKFKDVLSDFMMYEQDKYFKDIRRRRNAPRGRLSIAEETVKKDFYHFAANPNTKDNSYAVVEFKKGIYSVKFFDNYLEEKVLLRYGVRTRQGDINPNYPILSWDGKGSRLLVIYWQEGKLHMFIYDVIARIKRFKQEIEGFDQIQSAGFMLDANTLLLSAAKNGHTDIYTYRIDNQKITQVTNDVYDDLDPTFVSFPNRSGIIFASNRPGPNTQDSSVLPTKNRYNIYLVDIDNKSQFKQLTQMTNLKYGNARYPMQYNVNHFTYVSDENGINNRWAGFFSTARDGLDTLYYVGDEILRNPLDKELDSTLTAWQKNEPDSISYFQVYKDSTYTFPITNYQSSLLETRIAGDKGQVSEVRREGDYKFLYKLRVDSITLRKRNISASPTEYMRSVMRADSIASGKAVFTSSSGKTKKSTADTIGRKKTVFQSEFEDDRRPDSLKPKPTGENVAATPAKAPSQPVSALQDAKLFNYRLKFNADHVMAGITSDVLMINRYQPYMGGGGPIYPNNGNLIDFAFKAGVNDLFEDIKIYGGFGLGDNITNKQAFISFQNLRKRLDWGLTYYRSNYENYPNFFRDAYAYYDNMLYTNLYQANFSYPLNEVKSIRARVGLRTDRGTLRPLIPDYNGYDPDVFKLKDSVAKTMLFRLEYVHDNTINPTQNIWNGLRWKVYTDLTIPTSKGSDAKGKKIWNIGFDARYYAKIYRNFIWAGRVAGDASFGDEKMIYYLGGADGWLWPKFNNNYPPDRSVPYAFQALALNMRGFKQNVANGSKAFVINSELRLPVFTTFLNRPINSAFIRNFQLVQFIDLGNAWEGGIFDIKRPEVYYYPNRDDPRADANPVVVKIKTPGIGPLVGGYGFGARSTLLGYFLKLDFGWPMNGLFRGSPMTYFSLGLDF